MKRRKAIQSLSAILGYSLTPAMITGLMLSCEEKGNEILWKPSFFAQEDAYLIMQLGEALLPRTETPGAMDVNAHIFVDVFMDKVADPEDRLQFKNGVKAMHAQFEKITAKPSLEGKAVDFTKVLTVLLNISKAKRKKIDELSSEARAENEQDKETYHTYFFLRRFKKLIMVGYYASEEVGENVLSYLPVPGDYEGCIPLESVGNTWSIR